MLSKEEIEKAIAVYEGGANESTVAEATGIIQEEAKAVADAFNAGETDRLLREAALATLLEAAAETLRNGRGLVGDTARDIVRETWHNYPNAGMKVGEIDRKPSAHSAPRPPQTPAASS
jgi:hypothetical protein